MTAVFNAVRDLPYATDAAWNAAGLLEQEAGNCVAKSELLAQSLASLGHDTRLVRWAYAITDPFAHLLPVAFDIHTATQIRLDGVWVTIDATHDSALPALPFVVNDWNGYSDTLPAYEPISAVWIPGVDDEAIGHATDELTRALAGVETGEYQGQFNAWVRELRSTAVTTMATGLI
jgi:transglutaminase-like putative cysteine protease